jgi:FMN phosphatase YigB (HAD superfamily)
VIKALLLDLDDTLLETHIDRFFPIYLEKLGAFLSHAVPAQRLIPTLLKATQAMINNRDPERVLLQVFGDNFYGPLGTTEGVLLPLFLEFYATQFPSLRKLTNRLPEAKELVDCAFQAGLEVAVATKPLFPAAVNEERLAWAGVPAGENPYALITSADTFHFSKPSPAYYAEVLGRLGLSPLEAAMVGDDLEDDILPARSLGMPVFHIRGEAGSPYPTGGLADVASWFPAAEGQADAESARQPTAILAMLQGYLAALLTTGNGVTPDILARRPSPDSWAPVEIICHLRDVELEASLPRFRAILGEQDVFLSAVDPDPWATERDYLHQSPSDALAAFVKARRSSLALLEALPPEGWSRPARHALLGPTTLAEVASVIAEHDRLHLAQLRAGLTPAPASPTG